MWRSGKPVKPSRPSGLAALAAVAALLVLGWLAGLLLFVAQIPSEVRDPDAETDAVVVLTGGSERLQEGLRLLAEARARKLLISGVHQQVTIEELLQSVAQPAAGLEPMVLGCCVRLGHSADNTRGNARETADWMSAEGFRSLRLVTADYHMPRSLLEFRRAMPEIEILAHPVFPRQVKRDDWWRWPGTSSLLISEYNKYLLALLRGLLPWQG